jgi:hypothetical protein
MPRFIRTSDPQLAAIGALRMASPIHLELLTDLVNKIDQ